MGLFEGSVNFNDVDKHAPSQGVPPRFSPVQLFPAHPQELCPSQTSHISKSAPHEVFTSSPIRVPVLKAPDLRACRVRKHCPFRLNRFEPDLSLATKKVPAPSHRGSLSVTAMVETEP